MQRLVIAMVALISLVVTNPGRVTAQEDVHAVDPSRGSQPINDPVDPDHPAIDANHSTESTGEITISAAQTVDSVTVHARKLVIAGHVTHDVNATESTVVLEKGAEVGGRINVDDLSTVINSSALTVHVVPHLSASGQSHVHSFGSADAESSKRVYRLTEDSNSRRRRTQPEWFQAQLALFILGLLGSAFAVIVMPKASRNVAEHIKSQPKRDLKVGVVTAAVLLAVLLADALLLKMPLIRYLWAPFGIMIAVAPLILLGFGWVAAMRYAGDRVAQRMNRTREGSIFSRMALGLAAFFVANVILGAISPSLGVIGLCTEFAIALMGVGAAVVIAAGSGFGKRA